MKRYVVLIPMALFASQRTFLCKVQHFFIVSENAHSGLHFVLVVHIYLEPSMVDRRVVQVYFPKIAV